MSNTPRNSDGRLRRANQPKRVTNRSIIARWVEAETLHLKCLGMGYQAIADHIVEVAHGRQKAMVPVPQDVYFAEGYQISLQAVHRAFKRAIDRVPNTEVSELRKLGNERLEDMFLSLQPGIRTGDPRSIQAGARVVELHAELNGYKAPDRVDITGTRVDLLVQQQTNEAQALAELDRLTLDELREYRRLEAKARDTLQPAADEAAPENETTYRGRLGERK
jgi:hypothetical protein